MTLDEIKNTTINQKIFYIYNNTIKDAFFKGKSNTHDTFKIEMDGFQFYLSANNLQNYYINEYDCIKAFVNTHSNLDEVREKYSFRYPELFLF